MELKRTINNGSYLFCVGSVAISALLGYFLLVGIDKIENVTIQQMFFSTFTVFTQFGEMLFPFIVIYSISMDYKDKNVIFYRTLGMTPLKYFVNKVLSMLTWFSLAICVVTLVVSYIYGNFSWFLPTFAYFEGVMFFIIIVASLLGFFFKSMIVAFGVNLLLWVGGVIVHTVFPSLRYIAYFDATNTLYLDYELYLSTSDTAFLHLFEMIIYDLVTFAVAVIIVLVFSNRWKRNGV